MNEFKINSPIVIGSLAADPGVAYNGEIYYNTVANQFKIYQGGSWQTLATGGAAANTALSNLSAVAINADLKPASAGSINIGSSSLPFNVVYAEQYNLGSATNNWLTIENTTQDTANDALITSPNGSVIIQSQGENVYIQAVTGSVILEGVKTYLGGNQGVNLLNLPTDPTASPQKGDMYFNDVDNTIHLYNGTAWSSLATGGAAANLTLSNLTGFTANALAYASSANQIETDAHMSWNGSQLVLNVVDSYGGLKIQGRSGGEASFSLQPDTVADGAAGQWIFYTNGSGLNSPNDFAMYNSALSAPAIILQAATGFVGIGNNNPATPLDVTGAATIRGALDMNTHQIHNVTDPTSAQDAATKAYVDANSGINSANKALSNLASVAINADLLPGVANTINVGNTALPFASVDSAFYIINDGAGNDIYETGLFNDGTNNWILAENNDAADGSSIGFQWQTSTPSMANSNSGGYLFVAGTASGTGTQGSFAIQALNLNMNSTPIINVEDPTNAQDAATKHYVDTTALPLAGGQMTGALGLAQLSTAPSSPVDGDSYYDTTLGYARIYQGGAWISLLYNNNTTPVAIVGQIIQVGFGAVPPGTLECDGSAVSRTTYDQLFSSIGTNYGVGDGSTTFNLPDFRGMFIRGWDHGAGNDPDAASRTAPNGGNTGDNVGSYQSFAVESHAHAFYTTQYTDVGGGASGSGAGVNSGPGYSGTQPFGESVETRPRNVNAMFVIVYDSQLALPIATGITGLHGDVTTTGSAGNVAATVALVGGQTAAAVAAAAVAVAAGTALNTASTLVERDSSGNFAAGTITASLTGHASLDLALAGGTMTGAIDMGANQINDVADPTSPQDAMTLAYFNANAFTEADGDARYVLDSVVGQPSGVASLDVTGKVPSSQLPTSIVGALNYKGTWDASGGVYPSSPLQGDYYVVNVAGTLSGSGQPTHAYNVGDWLAYDGTIWDYIDNTQPAAGAGLTQTGLILSAKTDGTTIDTSGAGSSLEIVDGAITDAKVAAAAGIARNKLAALGANKVVLTDASGFDTDDNTSPVSLGADVVQQGATSGQYVQSQYAHSITLAASQASAVAVDASTTFAVATYQGFKADYVMNDGTNGRIGTIYAISAPSGSNASVADVGADTAALGVSFTLVLNGSNMELRYTNSSANVITMRLLAVTFLA